MTPRDAAAGSPTPLQEMATLSQQQTASSFCTGEETGETETSTQQRETETPNLQTDPQNTGKANADKGSQEGQPSRCEITPGEVEIIAESENDLQTSY